MNKHNATYLGREKGFSLLVALIFVAFFGTVLTTFVYSMGDKTLKDEAAITGWQVTKIARAARIYVRDEMVSNPNLKFNLDIDAAGPQIVPLATLADNALIPNDIARVEAGQAVSALNQDIVVIMANYPVDGNPNDDTTVPTAYVYLRASDRSDPSLIQHIVEEARRHDVSLSAPIYNAGVNISGQCNGMGDAVAMWDTGCLGEVEFTALTGEAAFTPGSLLVPAWRAKNFDARVLMRFPQPEAVGMTTMLTELEMGDPLTDCDTNPASRIAMPSDDGAVSDLCGAMNDNVGAVVNANADHRRDIIGANNISGGSYITDRQSGNDVTIDVNGVRTNGTVDETYALNVSANTIATGDMKIFNGDVNISGNTNVDRNAIVSTQTAGKIMSANIGNRLTAEGLSTKTLEVSNTVVTASNISSDSVSATPKGNINGGLTTQLLYMSDSDSMLTTDTASMLGNTETETTTITGAGNVSGYSYISGDLNARNVQVTNDIAANNTVNARSTSRVMGTLNVANGTGGAKCLGDCPERRQFCIDQGALSYDQCMITNGW